MAYITNDEITLCTFAKLGKQIRPHLATHCRLFAPLTVMSRSLDTQWAGVRASAPGAEA